MVRRVKLLVPQELPSGYLKNSAPPKGGDICHFCQAFDATKSFDIKDIHKCLAMADTGGVGGNHLPLQTEELVLKAPKKATLPENLSKNPKKRGFEAYYGL